MAVYHFAWDLEFFGYAAPGMTEFGGWKLFARAIASSFLFLVGVSLVLAHSDRIRWRGFWKRMAMVVAAAAAITLVTFFAVRDGFIFFGILHEIALASLIGLAFLRLPWFATLAVAAIVVAAPHFLRGPVFDHPVWWWLGLSSTDPHSNDYVPVFPWLGAVLAGIAAATLARSAGLFERMRPVRPGRWSAPLQFFGRHSLTFYLVHQPLLIACVWAAAQLFPPTPLAPDEAFIPACRANCEPVRDIAFCKYYCACTLERLEEEGLLGEVTGAVLLRSRPVAGARDRRGVHRRDRECRAGGGVGRMTSHAERPNRFPWPPVLYLAAAVIALALHIMWPLPWLVPPLSDLLFAIGWLLVLGAVALDVGAMLTMRRIRTTIWPTRRADHLVTQGPFSLTRNPIYVANTMLMLAIGFIVGSLWFLILAPFAAFATQKLAIEREERHLEARFGRKYRDYRKKVRRWI